MPTRQAIALPPGITLEWPRTGITLFGDGSATAGSGAISADRANIRFTIAADHGAVSFAP